MRRINMVIEVEDSFDPDIITARGVVEEMITLHNDQVLSNGDYDEVASLVSADWI